MASLSPPAGVPAGTILDFAGATAPAGYVLCAGQAISRTAFAALFNTIGTLWGAGDGSTTFNVPDLRGRVTAGEDDMGGTAANRITVGGSGINGAVIGSAGGTETHALTVAQLASHNHGVTDAGHSHTVAVNSNGVWGNNSAGANAAGTSDATVRGNPATATAVTGITIQNNGSGAAHQNTQPTAIVNKIIKT